MRYVNEELNTPVAGRWDVLVAGGGIAGAAAALSAARCGKRVLLLERGFLIGGLATAGLITIYLPLCDGMGQQVSYGMAEELLCLSISMGAEADYPDAWLDEVDLEKRRQQRFRVRFNAQKFALLLEEQLRREDVEIYFGMQVCAVEKEGNHLRSIIAEGKGGRFAFEAVSFVDATGDADLFALAGAKTRNFAAGNILAAWYYRLCDGELCLRALGAADVPDSLCGELKRPELLVPCTFSGLDDRENSEMVLLAHEQMLRDLRASTNNAIPVTLPTIPQLRMTRCIDGAFVLDAANQGGGFTDCIGRIADWRRRGYVYAVPLRALYGSIENLIAAGRCISVTDDMWDISRVLPACALTGEAAGAAAAISDNFAALDVRRLQDLLAQRCARPDIKEGSAC